MIRIIKTYPSAQTFGFFDVELRVQLLEATGNPLSRLDTVIDWEGFRPLLEQALAKPTKGPGDRPAIDPIIGRRNAAAIGLINLIYPAVAGARYESRFRIGTATNRRLKSED
jgi:hypothetical protein